MDQPKVRILSQNDERIRRILSSPSTSYWLRNAMLSAMNRDLLDAARDARRMADVLEARCDEALRMAVPRPQPVEYFVKQINEA